MPAKVWLIVSLFTGLRSWRRSNWKWHIWHALIFLFVSTNPLGVTRSRCKGGCAPENGEATHSVDKCPRALWHSAQGWHLIGDTVFRSYTDVYRHDAGGSFFFVQSPEDLWLCCRYAVSKSAGPLSPKLPLYPSQNPFPFSLWCSLNFVTLFVLLSFVPAIRPPIITLPLL